MDKYEYRVKTEQMLEHMEKKQYKKAMEIADTIDWRRVKNVSMLNMVSDIYEYNGEFQKSRDILFVAFDRAPGSRKIVYRLGTLALKIDDIEEASDCYEEFVKLAPKDPNQYILKYRILKAQGAPLSEQIDALEDFKKAEYIEKWAYELAKLYHEAGMTAECLEECDDLILWFSEGKYVYQAMELKMKYKPLTPLQQEKYDARPGAPKKARTIKPEKTEEDVASTPMAAVIKEAEAVDDEAIQAENISDITENLEQDVQETEAEESEESVMGTSFEEETDEEDTVVPEEADEPKRHSSITRIVKGATLQEALANGVAIASGINIEEKAMKEKDEALRVTGQMRIEEILQQWEAKQKVNAEAIEKQKKEDQERIRKEREEAKRHKEEERLEVERKAAEAEAARKAEEEAARIAAKKAEEEAERKAAEEAAWKAAQEAARLKAEEEAARIAAEKAEAEEAARIAAEEEAARIAAEEEAARKAAEEEAARIAAEKAEAEEAARKAAEEEAARIAAEKAEAEEAARKAAEEEAARIAAEEEAARKAAEKAKAEEEAARKATEEANKAEEATVAAGKTQRIPDDIVRLMEELGNDSSESDDLYDALVRTADLKIDKDLISNIVGDSYQDQDEEEDNFEEDDFEEEDFDIGDFIGDYEEEDFEEADFEEDDFEEEDSEEDFEADFDEDFAEEDYDEEDYDETDFEEEDFEEADFEEDFEEADYEEEYEEEAGSEEDYEEVDFEEEEFEGDDFEEEEFEGDDFEEEEFEEADEEEELEIEEPSEEEIQERIKKSKGTGVPFDTGFVVTGRYDLSATSEIGLKAGLTEEQKKLFSYFVPVRGMSEQIVEVLDNDRRAQREGTSKMGNLLVVGRKGSGKTVLAVDIVKAIQKQRNLKQGKVAIVTGESLNKKELTNIIQKLRGGAIIIEKAGKLNSRTVKELNYLMEKKTGELLFVLEDQRKPLERILSANPDFKKKFTSRLELPVFINDELVTFGQTYAKENGYKLDEMGILALYSRIDVMQREDHAVSVAEVKEIMDEAIEHSQKANVKHLARRVFGRSTDESDRIILKEEDFKI